MRSLKGIVCKDHMVGIIETSKNDEVTCNDTETLERGFIVPSPTSVFYITGTVQLFRSTNKGNDWEKAPEPGWEDSEYTSEFAENWNGGHIDMSGRFYFKDNDIETDTEDDFRQGFLSTSDFGRVISFIPMKKEVLEQWAEANDTLLNPSDAPTPPSTEKFNSLIEDGSSTRDDVHETIYTANRVLKRNANTFIPEAFDEEITFE